MNDLLLYFLKVNIAIALFYLFYRFFFANDTFWKTRRFYMLISIFISFIYPLFSIESWLQSQQPMQTLVAYSTLPDFSVTIANSPNLYSLKNLSLLIYSLVSIVLLLRLGVQFASILKIKKSGKPARLQHHNVITIEKEITPFSFFKTVYINPALHKESEIEQILTHEFTHVRQMHSIDVLISEILTILFWCNPATWLLKSEIRQNLEFLADSKVLESGFDTKNYQYHLLQLSYQVSDLKITNKFNVSPLKKRITMMNQQKTSKAGILKYLLIGPLALALVVSSNAETIINSAKTNFNNSTSKQELAQDNIATTPNENVQEQKKGDQTAASKKEDFTVFQIVEKMPEFPGGEQAMFKYLGENVKYPAEALKKQIQGRVICQFIVTANGSVASVRVLRGVEASLDTEALRVIDAMPKWTPGQQKGVNVNVQYVLPINFKLENDKTTVTTTESSISITDTKGGASPIFIVDGKEITEKEMNALNPQSIKDVSVLKDNAATSAYGEKGKNGVVVITLKK